MSHERPASGYMYDQYRPFDIQRGVYKLICVNQELKFYRRLELSQYQQNHWLEILHLHHILYSI